MSQMVTDAGSCLPRRKAEESRDTILQPQISGSGEAGEAQKMWFPSLLGLL